MIKLPKNFCFQINIQVTRNSKIDAWIVRIFIIEDDIEYPSLSAIFRLLPVIRVHGTVRDYHFSVRGSRDRFVPRRWTIFQIYHQLRAYSNIPFAASCGQVYPREPDKMLRRHEMESLAFRQLVTGIVLRFEVQRDTNRSTSCVSTTPLPLIKQRSLIWINTLATWWRGEKNGVKSAKRKSRTMATSFERWDDIYIYIILDWWSMRDSNWIRMKENWPTVLTSSASKSVKTCIEDSTNLFEIKYQK